MPRLTVAKACGYRTQPAPGAVQQLDAGQRPSDFVINHGAVLNLSLGGRAPDELLARARPPPEQPAWVVVAATLEGRDEPGFPARSKR